MHQNTIVFIQENTFENSVSKCRQFRLGLTNTFFLCSRGNRIRALGACLSRDLREPGTSRRETGVSTTSRSLPTTLNLARRDLEASQALRKDPQGIIVRNNVILSGNVEVSKVSFDGHQEGIEEPKRATPQVHQRLSSRPTSRQVPREESRTPSVTLVELIKQNKLQQATGAAGSGQDMASSGLYKFETVDAQLGVAYRLPRGSKEQLDSGAPTTSSRPPVAEGSKTSKASRAARHRGRHDAHQPRQRPSIDTEPPENAPDGIQGSKVTPATFNSKADQQGTPPVRTDSDFENFVIASVESCNRPTSAGVTIPYECNTDLDGASLQSLPGNDTQSFPQSEKQSLGNGDKLYDSSKSTLSTETKSEWPRGLPSGMKSPEKHQEHLDKMWYRNYLTYVRRKGYGRSKIHDMHSNSDISNHLNIIQQRQKGLITKSGKSVSPTSKPPLPSSGGKEDHINAFIADCVQNMAAGDSGVQNLLYRVYEPSNVPPPTPEVRSRVPGGLSSMEPIRWTEEGYDPDQLLMNAASYPIRDADTLSEGSCRQLLINMPVVETDSDSADMTGGSAGKLTRCSGSLPNIPLGTAIINQGAEDTPSTTSHSRVSGRRSLTSSSKHDSLPEVREEARSKLSPVIKEDIHLPALTHR